MVFGAMDKDNIFFFNALSFSNKNPFSYYRRHISEAAFRTYCIAFPYSLSFAATLLLFWLSLSYIMLLRYQRLGHDMAVAIHIVRRPSYPLYHNRRTMCTTDAVQQPIQRYRFKIISKTQLRNIGNPQQDSCKFPMKWALFILLSAKCCFYFQLI